MPTTKTKLAARSAEPKKGDSPGHRRLEALSASGRQTEANDVPTALRLVNGVVHAEMTLAQLQFISVHLEIAAKMEDGWLDWKREDAQKTVALYRRRMRDKKGRDAATRQEEECCKGLRASLAKTDDELTRNPWGLNGSIR